MINTLVASIPYIGRYNKHGFIINSKDPKDFYKAVKRLIEDRKLLKRIYKANGKKAERDYEASKVAKKSN